MKLNQWTYLAIVAALLISLDKSLILKHKPYLLLLSKSAESRESWTVTTELRKAVQKERTRIFGTPYSKENRMRLDEILAEIDNNPNPTTNRLRVLEAKFNRYADSPQNENSNRSERSILPQKASPPRYTPSWKLNAAGTTMQFTDENGTVVAERAPGPMELNPEAPVPRVVEVAKLKYGESEDPNRLMADFEALKAMGPQFQPALNKTEAQLQACSASDALTEDEKLSIPKLKEMIPTLKEDIKKAQADLKKFMDTVLWQENKDIESKRAAIVARRKPYRDAYLRRFSPKLEDWKTYSVEYVEYKEDLKKYHRAMTGYIKNTGMSGVYKIEGYTAQKTALQQEIESASTQGRDTLALKRKLADLKEPIKPIEPSVPQEIVSAAKSETAKVFRNKQKELQTRADELEGVHPQKKDPEAIRIAKADLSEAKFHLEYAAMDDYENQESTQIEKKLNERLVRDVPSELLISDPKIAKEHQDKISIISKSEKILTETQAKLDDLEARDKRLATCRSNRDYVLEQKRTYEATLANILTKLGKISKTDPDLGTRQASDDFLKAEAPKLFDQGPAQQADVPVAGSTEVLPKN